MQWLNLVVEELLKRHPDGEIVVSSGVSPSGKYHLGTLREVLTAEAIAREVRRRGRQARHIHVVDDLDFIRKVPVGIPESYSQYLGKPLCDIPAPDGSDQSYADYYLQDLQAASDELHLSAEIMRAHQKYRAGFFVSAIETALDHIDDIKHILETISGHQVDDNWSPVQVLENGYLINRPYVSHDTSKKILVYRDATDHEQEISYADGSVKLNWRIDWPARWSLLGVQAEPFGRDHATKGGSYDTGKVIVKDVYGAEPPYPLPYNFINRTGETKKMSKSAGETITLSELLEVLPAEVIWYFIVRSAPDKQLFFDDGDTLIRLIDDFGLLLAKPNKTAAEQQLVDLCMEGVAQPTISRVPFSHLVASYQASLKDVERTLDVIRRTEYAQVVDEDAAIIKAELKYIDAWLTKRAPEDVKFSIRENVEAAEFTETQQQFMRELADKVSAAPEDADGAWFHNAIYELKDTSGLAPKELFATLYQAIIGKASGPRAGYFLSILPRDWLVMRLKLES
ncbi:MAG TPA: lysine--tRNA ligase [Candidatus Saccharimonadales bacterium]|nr:lysine--tRNA ligase [Candidatus Saccharimonadales bacterium]